MTYGATEYLIIVGYLFGFRFWFLLTPSKFIGIFLSVKAAKELLKKRKEAKLPFIF